MKVVKIGAPWCASCIIMKPRWQEIEQENPWLETEYYDYDVNNEKLKEFNLGDDIPVFIFLDKEGNEIDRKTGELGKEEIVELINMYKDK